MGKAKVSLRTNEYVDASYVTGCFGGGGHKRASGCVIDSDVFTARDKVVEVITKLIDRKD
jgi:phosphoesterase RecJ-like protein